MTPATSLPPALRLPLDVVDELSVEIARRLRISAERAREIATEASGACGACGATLPGYRFVPLPDEPPELCEATAVPAAREFLARLPDYVAGRDGRGIVICAGGVRLFRCAWVCIQMLRRSGCKSPVELWHLGPGEITPEMERLITPLGVRCVDAEQVRRTHPVRTLRGWELKVFALLHSRFEQVLLLDADNVPLIDPGYLFDTREFGATGAMFWPDEKPVPANSRIHELFDISSACDSSFDTGQILLDKSRVWEPLNLTMHFNEHSDFYFRYFHGDAGTFQLAWKYLGREYSMTSHPMQRLAGVMCQHDFTGSRIFQHRHGSKWDDTEHRIEGFELEEKCREYCRQLEAIWPPAAS